MRTDYFFVEYEDNGVMCSDSWSEGTLNWELAHNEVKIASVSLAYWVQVKLGLVED